MPFVKEDKIQCNIRGAKVATLKFSWLWGRAQVCRATGIHNKGDYLCQQWE